MQIQKQINQEIKSPAQTIQFAKDGKYEKAWIIDSKDNRPNQSDIESYISREAFEKLIVEYIWNPNDDAGRFVLTVIQDETCELKDHEAFINSNLDILHDKRDFLTTVQAINSRIIGKDFLLESPAELIRLGVFNHWFSVGPIDLWKRGEILDKQVVEERINSRPEVKSSSLNFQGLAFIYNYDGELSGPYHILKTPCCRKDGKNWVVDNELVFEWMKKLV
jgi:hypothetical protein